MKYVALIALVFGVSAPALAQEQDLPRFDAFEQQQRDSQQQRFDDLDRARRDELLLRTPTERPGDTRADRAMWLQDLERERSRLELEVQSDRSRERQARDSTALALPNRVVPSYSSDVIRDPERYVLPPAPPGQYYARIDGKFALIDAATQKPAKIFDTHPGEPSYAMPGSGRASANVSSGWGYPKAKDMPGLPTQEIGPDSELVVLEPGKLSLGPPPKDRYYAQIEGRIYLIDAKTKKVIALVRP
jgi:Ni/Co efflux regulator RcnB